MLSLCLHAGNVSSEPWTWRNDCWTRGNSWIRPLDNPALIAQLGFDGTGRAVVLVRERGHVAEHVPAIKHNPVRLADARSLRPTGDVAVGGFAAVELSSDVVRLTMGPTGTAPIYLTAHGHTLLGSWHLPDLAPFIHSDALLDRAVARRLTRAPAYTSDTVFAEISHLTERATATFNGSCLTLTYPEPAEHVLQPRAVRPGVDIVAGFADLFARVIAGTPAADGPVAVELSGGIDSAAVAQALTASRVDPVHSYGLVLDGAVGAEQQARRAALVRRLGLRDTVIHAVNHPPFSPTGVRGRGVAHDPASAYYREAFDALRDAVAAGATRVVCTGLGGDELCARHPDEWTSPPLGPELPPWLGPTARAAISDVHANLAPVAPIALPTLMALASHNPAYLAAGIWPVSPLAHPALVRFGEQLPLTWRAGKRLLREAVRRAGLAPEVVDPTYPETFSGLMQYGLRHHGLAIMKAMLRESLLVDLGYLDHTALVHAYAAGRSGKHIPSGLCDAISLEVGLRSFVPGESRP